MKRKITRSVPVWLAVFFAGAVQAANLTEHKGPYLGLARPGQTPQVFAPEIFSRSKPEWAFCGVFSPDQREFYYSGFDTGKGVEQIMWMRRSGDNWTPPSPAPFNSAENANDSRLSPDGNT